ncbi:MAG: SDR family oxidoreductase [bacterium]
MRLLITGGSGLLGGNLTFMSAREGIETYAAYCSRPVKIAGATTFSLDITQRSDVLSKIEEIQPDVIIHTAAVTKPDVCEEDQGLAWRVNVTGTENLVQAAKITQTKFIYLSTDLVFDGRAGLYREDDPTNPLSCYAWTKLEGEKIVTANSTNCCIVRTAVIYGPSIGGGSFSEWVIRGLKEGQQVPLFVDQFRSPILVTNLAQALLEICHRGITGLYHLGGAERINRLDFGRILTQEYGFPEANLPPVAMDDFGFKAPRPKDCSFDISRAKKTFKVRFLGAKEGIKRLKELEDEGYPEQLRKG